MKWIADLIGKIYRWFWETVMQRREPYTFQLTRMMIAHGVFFWIFMLAIQGFLFWHLFHLNSALAVCLCVAGLAFSVWLIDHLIDYAREHPENWPD